MIVNYTDFLGEIDALFASSTVMSVSEFRQKAAQSKKQRKENIEHLSVKLNRLKVKIEKYKEKIREAVASDDKKASGIRLNQLMKIKQDLLKTYREEKNQDAFAGLSSSCKVCACTKSLLQKYILATFVRSSPKAYSLNSDGSVTLNIEFFRNSDLYQQAQHIRDYISSYIENHEERVKGERYFIGLHKNIADFAELVAAADDYFEKLNAKIQQDNLTHSHEGIEQIALYPEYNVQAVQLTSKEALAYEGAQMHHCVKSYADKVEKGLTSIYSIRDIGDETTEFCPHATIEFKEGKIVQIKGPRDSLIDEAYVEATKKFLMLLMKTENFADILTDKSISDAEKRNIGLFQDAQGDFYDLYNLPAEAINSNLVITNNIRVKDTRLKALPLQKIKLKQLEVSGIITNKTIQYLSQAKGLEELTFVAETDMPILDLSSVKCSEIKLNLKKASHLTQIILPATATSLTIEKSNIPQLYEIATSSPIKKLNINGIFNKLTFIPQDIEVLRLTGEFKSLDSFFQGDLSNLQVLSLGGNLDYLPEKLAFSQLKEMNIGEASVERLESIDVSSCTELKVFDLANSRFHKLKTLNVPKTVKHFSGAHCVFDTLEDIDVSAMPYANYGTLELLKKIQINLSPASEEFKICFPELGGYVTHWAVMPNLREIYFPENVTKIFLEGMRLKQYDFASLAKYKNLQELSLGYSHIDNNDVVDISLCENLEYVRLSACDMPFVELPPHIKRLKLEKTTKEDIHHLPDLRKYKELSSLYCDFMPDMTLLPQSLTHLEITISDKIENNVLDFSHIENLIIKPSLKLTCPNVEKILLAKNFNDVMLYNTCPLLTEIDISQTQGQMAIKQIIHQDETKTILGEKNIHLTAEQFDILRKIKIGPETELVLPTALAERNIILEIPATMPTAKVQELKQKYPYLNIKKEQPERILLLPQKGIAR